jgi:hypothetical protein
VTLPSLLSKMSRRTSRFVTVDGIVVSTIDGVERTADGFSHPSFGLLTPVRRHENHGGSEAVDATPLPWWDQHPELLASEQLAMGRAFPSFDLVEVDGRVGWRGELNTGRGRFEVTILHWPGRGLPQIVPTRPSLYGRRQGRRLVRSPHLFLNGNLCVARSQDWDPTRDDATTVVAWTAHWLAAFTEWRITGRWPCSGIEIDDVA